MSGTVPALGALLEPVRRDLDEVERLMERLVADVGEPLGSGLRYVLGSGKRLRPALVLLCGRLFAPPGGTFHRLAAAVEMLHTATLIHDDLVDGAARRRGRATLHTLWPTGAAVLAGDHLMALAVGLVADLACPPLVSVFAETLRAMSAGEIRQLLGSVAADARQEYYRRVEAKTASLCAAASKAAGILAGAEETAIAALHQYGMELGIAFQIADDVLDLVGDERILGKPSGSDVRQGNLTLPVILYFERLGQQGLSAWGQWPPADEAGAHALSAAVRASPAIGLALEEADAHARAAQGALEALPDCAARSALHLLAAFAVARQH